MSHRPQCALALLLAACNLRPYDDVSGASATSGTTATTGTGNGGGASSGTSTGVLSDSGTASDAGTAASTEATTASDPTSVFIPYPDWSGPILECDAWAQNCPDGQKCVPYSADGDLGLESLKCVPVVPDPDGLDEPCKVLGAAGNGEDTCDRGLLCYVDSDTGEGSCLALCAGSPDAPVCPDPWSTCSGARTSVFHLCIPDCDPLLQDCGPGDVCIRAPSNDWICIFDASGDEGQAFDSCEFDNTCDPGLLCLDSEFAAECAPDTPWCCIPLCDLTLPNTCPGQGQECLPWYEPGQAQPGYEHVGHCGLPDP